MGSSASATQETRISDSFPSPGESGFAELPTADDLARALVEIDRHYQPRIRANQDAANRHRRRMTGHPLPEDMGWSFEVDEAKETRLAIEAEGKLLASGMKEERSLLVSLAERIEKLEMPQLVARYEQMQRLLIKGRHRSRRAHGDGEGN